MISLSKNLCTNTIIIQRGSIQDNQCILSRRTLILINSQYFQRFMTFYDFKTACQFQSRLLIQIDYYHIIMISNKTLLEDNKISTLCFSPNFQNCAVALKSNNSLLIYEVPKNEAWDINKWILKNTLNSLDWSSTNKLLSGSHDRSVSVWQKKSDKYIKQLANLSNKLSIICAKWSLNGEKFAIGTSCKSVYIGFYNHEENFWSGLLLKPKDRSTINSTVTTLSFHKSGNLIAIGSADFSVRVLTCNLSVQAVTTKADRAGQYQGAYGNVNSFGEVILTLSSLQGWINQISFAPNAAEIFVLPHNNSVSVYGLPQTKEQQPTEKSTNWNGLPFLSGFYLNDDLYAAGGFDRNIVIFQRSSNGFQVSKTLQTSVLQKMSLTEKKTSLVSGMKNMWDKSGMIKVQQRLSAQQTSTQHKGAINITRYGNWICSFDTNGVINFWQP